MTRPLVFHASDVVFLDPQIVPDVLTMFERGIESSDLRRLLVRPEARAAVEQLRAAWRDQLGNDDDDGSAFDGTSEPSDAIFATVNEIALRAEVSPTYVRRLCRRGVLCSRKVAGRLVIERAPAEAWLDSRKATR